MTTRDLLGMARTALGAASTCDDLELKTHYLASARLAFKQAWADLIEIERVLVGLERELLRRAGPRQILMSHEEPNGSGVGR
jgi:hypothetical protein